MILKALLVLHGVAAAALAGAAVHNALLAWRRSFGDGEVNESLRRVYARVIGWLYPAVFLLGCVLYPAFRVEVRAAWLDEAYPLAKACFEIKEHALAFGLPLLIYVVLSSRRLPGDEEAADLWLYDAACVALAVLVGYAALTGMFVTALRPV